MSNSKPTVWLVGDDSGLEFAPAIAWLREHSHLTHITAPLAVEDSHRITEPDVIVIIQARPGQFSSIDVERLHRRAPLARLVGLLGTWCEGETRSGHPWPGVPRIYAHQWETRLPAELIAGRQPSGAAARPRSFSDLDQLIARGTQPAGLDRGLLGLIASNRSDFEALASGLGIWGFSSVWLAPSLSPPQIVVDGLIGNISGDLARGILPLQRVRAALQDPPTWLLIDFPRDEDLAIAHRAGILGLFARPLHMDDLGEQLCRTLPVKRRHHCVAA